MIPYANQLLDDHRTVLSQAAVVLQEGVPELEEIRERALVLTTGSDGREEKRWHSPNMSGRVCSPLELIFVSKDPLPEETLNKVREVVEKNPLFFSYVEERTLSSDSMIRAQLTDRVFPSRATDASFIFGDPALFQEYQRVWREQVKSETHYQSFVKKYKNKYRKDLENSLNGSLKDHFDISTGELKHDGKYCQGPKFTHLRAVQTTITHIFCKALKERDDSKWSDDFPHATVDRVAWLNQKELLGKMPDGLVEKTQEAYLQALKWYHDLQEKQPPASLFVDPNELQQVTQVLHNFVQLFKKS